MKYSFLLCLLIAITSFSRAQQTDLTLLANRFIQTLNDAEQLKAVYPFDSDERYHFQFVPRPDRKGISVNEMNGQQKQAAFRLLAACLSTDGYKEAAEIMQLEKILKVIEN